MQREKVGPLLDFIGRNRLVVDEQDNSLLGLAGLARLFGLGGGRLGRRLAWRRLGSKPIGSGGRHHARREQEGEGQSQTSEG